ncbi:hypothetical protein C2845_PM12G08480 [Panicum miliaceum]|uniref:Uncharacterized protein n=1 Tax=Panicum miliaceum TaxID=4540 RepID=A0A3L6QEH2_PANMI|nr:hypothetical protein C2845_PM12G08480 [Panicum miliaceum]
MCRASTVARFLMVELDQVGVATRRQHAAYSRSEENQASTPRCYAHSRHHESHKEMIAAMVAGRRGGQGEGGRWRRTR